MRASSVTFSVTPPVTPPKTGVTESLYLTPGAVYYLTPGAVYNMYRAKVII